MAKNNVLDKNELFNKAFVDNYGQGVKCPRCGHLCRDHEIAECSMCYDCYYWQEEADLRNSWEG